MASPSVRQLSRAAVAISLLSSARAGLAGDLDRARKEVRQGSSGSSERHHSQHSHGHDHSAAADPVAEPLEGLAAPVLAYLFFFPWLVPHALLEADRPADASFRTRFADYPYADGASGLLIEPSPHAVAAAAGPGEVEAEDADGSADPGADRSTGQSASAQLAAEAGLTGAVHRNALRARIQFPVRLELDADWARYHEVVASGLDLLWLGREHLSFRFAESSTVQFRSGLGPQHMIDAKGWVHGLDFTWGFEAFPLRPLVFAFEASLGGLGKAFTAGLIARLGVMLGPVEIAVGWNQRWLGSVPLGGAFASAQLWF